MLSKKPIVDKNNNIIGFVNCRLHYFYGDRGTGKTNKLVQCMLEAVAEGENTLLVVPYISWTRRYREMGYMGKVFTIEKTMRDLQNGCIRAYGFTAIFIDNPEEIQSDKLAAIDVFSNNYGINIVFTTSKKELY